MVALSLTLFLSACAQRGQAGTIELSALGSKPLVLERALQFGHYAQLESEISFWFSDVPFETLATHSATEPMQDAVFLHAQLVWEPEPGRTPLASTATNVVTRVVIVSGGEIGLYGGAAFARPRDAIGDEQLEIVLRGGTLTLLAHTPGFHDLLSPVGLHGTLTASCSTEETNRWRRGVSQLVTNALGRSMWVSNEQSSPTAGLLSSR